MKFLSNWITRLKGRPAQGEQAALNMGVLSAVMNRLPDPDLILRRMGGRMQLYRDMMSDDQVAHAAEIIEMAVKSMHIEVEAGEASEYMVDFCQEMMQLWDQDAIVESAINYRLLGYQPFELLYETSQRQWVITDIVGKPSDWFDFTTEGKLLLNINGKREQVNPWNFAVLKNKATYENPYGMAVLSSCFWPVTFKRGGIEFWLKFVEKYGTPYLIGKVPRGSSQREYDQMVERLDAMVQDAVAAIPNDSSVEILTDSAKGASGELHEAHVRYHDRVIMKRIAGSTLISDQGDGSGSFALSKTHAHTTQMIIDAVRARVLSLYNTAFKRATLLNRQGEMPPTARFARDEGVQLEVAERDNRLYATGVRFKKSYFENLYKLPSDDFEVTDPVAALPFSQPPKPALSFEGGCNCEGCRAQRAKAEHFTQPDTATADLPAAEQQLEDAIAKGAFTPVTLEALAAPVQQVIDLIADARTPEQAMTVLAEAYPELDVHRLQERLTRAMFVTAVWGRINENADT